MQARVWGSSAPGSTPRELPRCEQWFRRSGTTGPLSTRHRPSMRQPLSRYDAFLLPDCDRQTYRWRCKTVGKENVTMILFALQCAHGHEFEGWFRDGDGFAAQQDA